MQKYFEFIACQVKSVIIKSALSPTYRLLRQELEGKKGNTAEVGLDAFIDREPACAFQISCRTELGKWK